MHAVILAGGRGRRLAPYTVNFPKPLVPVGDLPILEIVLRQLHSAGCRKATLAVGHLAELIMAYFGKGEHVGIELEYSREEKPLGTIGPLRLIDNLPENFVVMNGDVLTTLRYRTLFKHHLASGADLTIACHRSTTKVDLGVLEYDDDCQVTGYREKPVLNYDVSMGVYVLNRRVLDLVEPGEYFDFPSLVHKLVAAGRCVKVFKSNSRWLDIGRVEDYSHANAVFEEHRESFLPQRKRRVAK